MVTIIFISLLAGARPLAWSKTPTGYDFNYHQVLENQESDSSQIYFNYSGSTIQQEVHLLYTLHDKVVQSPGSAGDPPWTSPFSSVYDNTAQRSRSYTSPLGANSWGYGYEKLTVEHGAETWTNGSQVAQRRLVKHTVTTADQFKVYPLEE